MKVIIAGDREFNDFNILEKAINKSPFKDEITEVVQGGARGADKLAKDWARINKIPCKEFKANWDDWKRAGAVVKERKNPWTQKIEKYDAAAGATRNEQMAQYAEALIAIQVNGPTPGTQNMIKLAKDNKLKVYVYEKDDEDYQYTF